MKGGAQSGCFEVALRRNRSWMDQRITVQMLTKPCFCFLWRSWRPVCPVLDLCSCLSSSPFRNPSSVLDLVLFLYSFVWNCMSVGVFVEKRNWSCLYGVAFRCKLQSQSRNSLQLSDGFNCSLLKTSVHFKVPKVVIKLLQKPYA